jgi:MFS family permease
MLERVQGQFAEAEPQQAGGPVIVTVHGTNDADLADDGMRWWQRGSEFTQHLIYRLAERSLPDAEILPLHWSGQNSDFDRLKGAEKLAHTLKELDRAGRPHAVIAHSHGGNVTVEGLTMAGRSPLRGGIVSFGTPFFKRRLKTVPMLIALFQTVLGLVIPPIMIWYLIEILPSSSNKKIEAVIFFGALAALGVWSFLKGVRKLGRGHLATRLFSTSLAPEQWLVVHSPRDEAMRLLETAAALSPQYVTTPAALRSLTAFASLAGVVATVAFFIWTGSYFMGPIIEKLKSGTYGLALGADLTFLLLVPVIYGAVFFAVWGIARLGGAWLYAKMLTSAIHGGVLGAAFGGDGPYSLVGVTRLPPYLIQAREECLEALDLGGIDDAALFVAAQSLYNSVVANDGPEGGIAHPELMWKRLSDALYHNAYMRDGDVVAGVADHLVTMARRQ